METKFKNYGVIPGWSSAQTYIAGTIEFEERNTSGEWTDKTPPGEWQKSDNGDSQGCVSFAEENGIECQELNLTGNQVNYSDRWIAKMSRTTRKGNYLDTVAETIRTVGLVREESYPAPKTYTWDEYHADIPEPLLSQLKAEGQEWLKKWDVRYEKTDLAKSNLKKQLKQAPVIVVIPGHAILLVKSEQIVDKIFDSYAPFFKDVPGPIYPSQLTYAMKLVLYQKEKAPHPYTLYTDLKKGYWGPQVEKLKNVLTIVFPLNEKNRKDMPLEDMPDFYGDYTQEWIWRFYKANLNRFSWVWLRQLYWHKGSEVGKDERDVINKLLK